MQLITVTPQNHRTCMALRRRAVRRTGRAGHATTFDHPQVTSAVGAKFQRTRQSHLWAPLLYDLGGLINANSSMVHWALTGDYPKMNNAMCLAPDHTLALPWLKHQSQAFSHVLLFVVGGSCVPSTKDCSCCRCQSCCALALAGASVEIEHFVNLKVNLKIYNHWASL